MNGAELKKIFLFNSFDDSKLKKLAEICKETSYTKGSILFYEGDESKKLYILTNGCISVNKTDSKGTQTQLHRFFAGSLIAEMATFEGKPYPATARFESNGSVLEVDFERFRALFLSDPKVLFEIIKSLCSKIRGLESTITYSLTLDTTERVAKFLLEHEKEAPQMKHSEMASILNMAPETLSRVLKKLRNSGIISESVKNFEILDRERLKSII